jgi:hypothetical protein
MAVRVLGDSTESKLERSLGHVKYCGSVTQKCVEHLRTLPGEPISDIKFDDSHHVEEWAKHSMEWNKYIASDTSIADLIMIMRIHVKVARDPSILSKKLLIAKPLTLLMELQRICQQWPVKPVERAKIEELRLACYAMVILHNQKEIITAMISSCNESKDDIEKGEQMFRVSAMASQFVSCITRTFMPIDLSFSLISHYPIQELKVPSTCYDGLDKWIQNEMLLQPSDTLLQAFRATYYTMSLPLGGESWYQRNPLTGEKKSHESIYYVEIPDTDDASKAIRKQVSDADLALLYKSDNNNNNNHIKNALIYSTYGYMFLRYLGRPWTSTFTVLESEMCTRLSTIHETHTFGQKRLPLILQMGSCFYVHHNGRCNHVAGSIHRDVRDAIVLWAYIMTTEYGGKLSYGEDASDWFRLFN